MVMDPAIASELSLPFVGHSAEVTRRTTRPIPDSAEERSEPIFRIRRGPVTGGGGVVTRGTPPHIMPVLPPPNLIPMVPDSAEATSGLIPPPGLRRPRSSQSGIVVTRRTPPSTMPILPPSGFIPIGQAPLPPGTESQAVLGDENPYKGLPRGRIPCLRCKEHSINCHGPETKYYGDCLKCHEAGKRCEFEAHVLDAPSSLLNLQYSAIDDAIPHQTASTSNDKGTHNNIPDPQPNTSSSGRQTEQKTPIIDDSRDREISNTTSGITTNGSISDEPRIKPWWKRIFCFR